MATVVTVGQTNIPIEKGKLDLTNNLDSFSSVKWNGNELLVNELIASKCPKLTSLRGIEQLQNLEKLVAEECNIEDVSALASLKKLKYILLKSNKIHDTSVFKNHPELVILNINYNRLLRIPDLTGCKSLEALGLFENAIIKIEGLDGQGKLDQLILSYNKITKIEGLRNLQNLKTLHLQGNQISKIEGIETSVTLEELDLASNKLTSLGGLENLKNLKLVYLWDNSFPADSAKQLQNLLPRAKLQADCVRIGQKVVGITNGTVYLPSEIQSLEQVNWNSNELKITSLQTIKPPQLKSLAGIERLQNLQVLGAVGGKIKDMLPLKSLTKLKTVLLKENMISKIEGLDSSLNLEALDLSYNQINRLEGLEALSQLKNLILTSNKIQKIENINRLQNLNVLGLGRNQIVKIEGLESLTNLKELYLWENKITRIEGLNALTNLKELQLDSNQIAEITGLTTLERLVELFLKNNQITEIKNLGKLGTKNEYGTLVNLQNNKITSEVIPEPLPGEHRPSVFLDGNPVPPKLKSPIPTPTKTEPIKDAIPPISFQADPNVEGRWIISLDGAAESLQSINWNNRELEVTSLEIIRFWKVSQLTKSLKYEYQKTRHPALQSLAGIEKLQNLQFLTAWACEIKDISALRTLKKLKIVKMKENKITDASPLGECPELDELDLSTNQLSQTPNLQRCSKLTVLQLDHNEIKFIQGLEQLSQLKELNLESNHINQIEGLSSLRNLEKLILTKNMILRLEGLSTLVNLKNLVIRINHVAEIKDLRNMAKLETLDLAANNIHSLRGLETLPVPRLRALTLTDNPLYHIDIIEQYAKTISPKDLVRKYETEIWFIPPVTPEEHRSRLQIVSAFVPPDHCLYCKQSVPAGADQAETCRSEVVLMVEKREEKIPKYETKFKGIEIKKETGYYRHIGQPGSGSYHALDYGSHTHYGLKMERAEIERDPTNPNAFWSLPGPLCATCKDEFLGEVWKNLKHVSSDKKMDKMHTAHLELFITWAQKAF